MSSRVETSDACETVVLFTPETLFPMREKITDVERVITQLTNAQFKSLNELDIARPYAEQMFALPKLSKGAGDRDNVVRILTRQKLPAPIVDAYMKDHYDRVIAERVKI